MNSLSQRIKYYRRKKGLTMDGAASALGIRTDNYAKYESGARSPKDDRLLALSKILGVSYNALNEGVEQEFVGLLNRHAISAVLGKVESFDAFYSDMEASSEAYYVVAEFFNRSDHYFAANDADYYRKYIENPGLDSLIAQYGAHKSHSGKNENEFAATDGIKAEAPNGTAPLDAEKATKWAFCVAVHNYLENANTEAILREAGKMAANIDALQFFAVKVFVPYLSFIIDAVELCVNTTIDDFENAFLFDALTTPDDDDDADNDEQCAGEVLTDK
jgi:transcriptional regulator with XRE-family HTH domain